MIIPAGSSRRAFQPPFWRIVQLDRAFGPSSPCSKPPEKNDEVGILVEKTRKPPSLPAPILANFPARSGCLASQPLFDAAGKNDEVGIPVEKRKRRKKSNGECTRWHVCNTVSEEKYRGTKLLSKNQNISESFSFLAGVNMIVTNSQFCTGIWLSKKTIKTHTKNTNKKNNQIKF